jgi:hypothetical protein
LALVLIKDFSSICRFRPGQLIDGTSDLRFREAWAMARTDTFSAAG